MSTQYDANILQTFADDLYAQARSVVVTTACLYALVGLAVGAMFAVAVPHNDFAVVFVAGFGVLGTGIGVSVGKKKAFELKFKAQQLLCQMQIEKNTRAKGSSLAATAGN